MTSVPPDAPDVVVGPRPRRRRLLAAVLWVLVPLLLLVVAAGAYLTSPWFVNGRLAPWLEKKLDRRVGVRRVEPHWFRGFRLVGVQIYSSAPGGPPLLSIDSADVRISLTDLLRGKLTVAEIEVDSPQFSAFRDSDGRLSIGDLLEQLKEKHDSDKPKAEAPPPPPPASASQSTETAAADAQASSEPESHSSWRPPDLRIKQLAVRNGKIMFKDASISPAIPIVLSIEDLDFTVRDFGETGPAPVSASFRARYQGVGLVSPGQVEPIDLNLRFTQDGVVELGLQQYRIDTMRMELSQRGRLVGVGRLDQPFRLTWDQRAPTVQVNPADFSLKLESMDLTQFNPQIFPHGADRITTGVLTGDLSASVGGGGRLVDLAGTVKVNRLGMTQLDAIDLWAAMGLSFDLRSRTLSRYSADVRLIKNGRAQGKIRLHGAGDPEQGGQEGSLAIEKLDLTVLGANLAGMSRDVVVDSGKLDMDQTWSLSPDHHTLTTRGAVNCSDVVFGGEKPGERSEPITVHVETDLRLDNGRLVGGGPLGRGARIETLQGRKPLDDMTVLIDVASPDPQRVSAISVSGPTLSLQDYISIRQIARQGQRLARKKRKAQNAEMKEMLKTLGPEILTSPTLDAEALSSPPQVPEEAKSDDDHPPKALGLPPFRFDVRFDKVLLAGEQGDDLRLRGRFDDPRIEVTTATVHLGEGTIVVKAGCDLEPKPRAFSWDIQTQSLDVQRALAGVLPEWKDRLSGRLDAQCSGSGRGGSEEDVRANLTARARFAASNGEVRSIAPLAALARTLEMPEFARFPFAELKGEASLRKGRVELSRVEGWNDRQKLALQGSITADGTVDWVFAVAVKGSLRDAIADRPIAQALLEDAQGYAHFPALVEVIGTWDKAESQFASPAETSPGPAVRIEPRLAPPRPAPAPSPAPASQPAAAP